MLKDLTGQKYGRWTVLGLSTKKYRRMAMWYCRCECGTEREVLGINLTSGKSVSCGCFKVERTKESKTTHGDSTGGKTKRLYNIWQGMKQRCENPRQNTYVYYGGRGIKVCEDWHDYKKFKEWALSNGYNDTLTIDRVNSDGNYEPSNCRWVTYLTQERNTSHNNIIEINGVRKCLSEWLEYYKMPRTTVSSRISRGWDAIKALTVPINSEAV